MDGYTGDMFQNKPRRGQVRPAASAGVAIDLNREYSNRRSHDERVNRALNDHFFDFSAELRNHRKPGAEGSLREDVAAILFPDRTEKEPNHVISPSQQAKLRLKHAVKGIAEYELQEDDEDRKDLFYECCTPHYLLFVGVCNRLRASSACRSASFDPVKRIPGIAHGMRIRANSSKVDHVQPQTPERQNQFKPPEINPAALSNTSIVNIFFT